MQELIFILTIAGCIGLFLYGMKLMGEALQKVTGEKLRSLITTLTSNRFRGIISGVFVAGLIQSSTATTVMMVSFVNAGLLRLIEAIAVIMGANIGTTFTTWLIASFGFKINALIWALPLIGISIPLTFSKNRKQKNWGEMLLGFALMFIAISLLNKEIDPPSASWLSQLIEAISSLGYVSYIFLTIVGVLITIPIRSSSATFVLTLVLATKGWIGFDQAAAMLLGANLGTTLAAIVASKVANSTAKRAALAHFIFNLFGIIWMLAILPNFLNGIAKLFMFMGGYNPYEYPGSIPLALALFHTSFNLLNTVILSWFIKRIIRFATRVIPSNSILDNELKLSHIKIGLLSTPDASLYQARREAIVFAERVRKMFRNVERLYNENNDKEYNIIKNRVLKAEEFSDMVEKEIAGYLTKVAEGRLSEANSKRLRGLYKMIDDIESIADSCINILNTIERKRELKIDFPEAINNNIALIFNMVKEALDTMVTMLTHDEELPLSMAQQIETEINNFRDILKSEHLDNLERGIYKYDAGILYNDIISQSERIGDYAINVDEAIKSISINYNNY